MRLLLLDDCLETAKLIQTALSHHEVEWVSTILDGKNKLKSNQYDLIFIDVNLPDGNGFDFCAELCRDSMHESMVKIMLTGLTQVPEKVYGFSCGADDYITKPFSMQELSARTTARLKNVKSEKTSVVVIDSFEFDINFQKCSFIEGNQKTDLMLTPTEFRIFLTLAKRKGQALSRREILKHLWHANGLNIQERGLDSHVSHLRKKLKNKRNQLMSVYGKGYSWSQTSSDKTL